MPDQAALAQQSVKVIEYQTAVRTSFMCSQLLAQHDLDGMLRAIEHSETMGPLLDPSLWLRNHEAMAQDKAVLGAAHAFVLAVEKVKAQR